MMYDFDTLLQRQGTDSSKWDAIERDFGRGGLMPFWVADADFPVLPELHTALADRAAEHHTFGYTFASDAPFSSIIGWYKRRRGLEVAREEIIPTTGVVTAAALAIQTLSSPGGRVLISPPVYTPFFDTVRSFSRELVESPLVHTDADWEIDFADLEAKLSSGVEIYLISSPHNPVGRVWTRAELERIAELCRKHGVRILSDEIWSDIILGGRTHIPILEIDPTAVLLSAPSKTFNIAGLKTSFMIVKDAEAREKIAKLNGALHLYPNLFGLKAMTVAYENGAAWVDEMCAYMEENAKAACAYIAENIHGVSTYVPESTYLMWLDFEGAGVRGRELEERLMDAGVALNPGSHYGEGYDAYARLNIACPRAYLLKGLDAIAKEFAR